MSTEMNDRMRLLMHRPAPEQCWCSGGKVSARCRIHGNAVPSADASAPLEQKPTVAPCDTAVRPGGPALLLTITGQIVGGKNNICITKKGKRFPNASWAKWRDAKVREVFAQLPPNWQAITEPRSMRLDYVAGDRRRRDMPAVIDAIFHVMEKAGVVVDDTLLWITSSCRSYDKGNPRATITIL